jgi:hypothetical protein
MAINNRTLSLASLHRSNHLPLHLQPPLLLSRAEACKHNLTPNVGDQVQVNKSFLAQAGLRSMLQGSRFHQCLYPGLKADILKINKTEQIPENFGNFVLDCCAQGERPSGAAGWRGSFPSGKRELAVHQRRDTSDGGCVTGLFSCNCGPRQV